MWLFLVVADLPSLSPSFLGSFGKNGTSNFNDEMEWAWHVESHARYADIVRPFCCLL